VTLLGVGSKTHVIVPVIITITYGSQEAFVHHFLTSANTAENVT
jgi:hypothetical protein